MKRLAMIPLVCLALGLPLAQAQAANVGVDINIHAGTPAPPPPPLPVGPRIIIEEPPLFLLPPTLGFHVAVGVPYDLFYVSDSYYLYRDNGWYRAPHYSGPWVRVERRYLPPGLRRHKFERIRYVRDEEYRHYREDEEHYHGRHFRPDKEWKERRKEEHEMRKEEKRWEKEERKRHKKHKHEDD